jgi:hypothetical protein
MKEYIHVRKQGVETKGIEMNGEDRRKTINGA